ncbi:MAG: Dephospho-CoA kinase [Chlamydiae bacterium]|nr:Dephospho-CoA kinase [Chlamydiota bacterium]
MRKVAVTGGLASGKSTVCRFFEKCGAFVVSADAIVHKLLSPSTPLGRDIISLLGEEIVAGEKIDREAVAARVFRDPSLLEKLEQRVHPQVQKEIEIQYQLALEQKSPLFVVEIPLFEKQFENEYDTLIEVQAEEAICKKRFIETTTYEEEEFERREARLRQLAKNRRAADFILENSGNLNALQDTVQKTYNLLKETP